MQQQLPIRPFLDALYRPPQWINTPTDDTVVCRCGMGPCQGRQCGLTVSQILANALGKTVAEVGA